METSSNYIPITPENVDSLSASEKVIKENIPLALKILKRWCVWTPIRDENNQNKIKKIPSQVNGKPCDWSNPDNLMSFEDAYKTLEENPKFGGVQFSIYDSDNYVGFDYDNCVGHNGDILNTVLSDFEKLGCPYAEFTPSTKGVRFILFGYLDKNHHQQGEGKPEIYCMKKPLTITGRKLDNANVGLISNDIVLQDVVNSYYPDKHGEKNTKRTSKTFADEKILEKIQKQRNGSEIMEAYRGKDVCNDRSATDFKVISAIAFYTQNIAQIYRLFENSGLVRPNKCKRNYAIVRGWEEEVENAGVPHDYITMTICNAIDRLTEVYNEQKVEVYCKVGNYTVNSEGVTVTKSITTRDKKSGEQTVEFIDINLTPTVVYVSAFGYNERDQKYYVQIKIRNPHNTFITKWVEPEQLTIKKNLLSMANQISMTDSDAESLNEFFKLSITESQKNSITEVYSATGYQKDNSCFVLGNRKITAENIEEIVPIDMPLASKLTKKGTIEGYTKAGTILMQYDPLRMKAYAMHASVLLPLVFHKNVTVTHTAISGNLKGQSSYWIMGAYGHPKLLQTNPTSTEKALQTHIMESQSLPTSIEELTGKSKVIKDLQYNTTTGVSRETLTRSSNLKGGQEIVGIVAVNAEYPLFTQKDRLGNKVRNFDIDEVIPYLDSNMVLDMENAIQGNYGHAAEILITEILKEKDNLLDMLKAFEQNLPDVGNDIPKNRFKAMCAFFALSGHFVEKMFKRIGIPNKDPLKLVPHYMEKNLGSGLTKSLTEIALPSVAEYFIKNRLAFETPAPGEREPAQRKGYIEKKALCFLPDDLEKFLVSELGEGMGRLVLQDLKRHDCLITKDKNNPNQLKESHKESKSSMSIPVYKIKKEALKQYASLDLDNLDPENEENDSIEDNQNSVVKKPIIPEVIEQPKITDDIRDDLFMEA